MQRRFSSLVGKVRLNESVSSIVSKEFSKFPLSCDRVEIFDNSIPNDPSPPCKAAGLLLRSKLSLPNSGKVSCATVLRRKIFDYNNKDFQKYQLQSLIDGIATNWLREAGGGIQLTIHRIPAERRPAFGIFNGDIPHLSAEAEARSLEFGRHRNWKILHGISFHVNPFKLIGNATKASGASCPESMTVDGLSEEISTYSSSDTIISIIFVDKLRRRVYCNVDKTMQGETVTREKYRDSMTGILRMHKCLTGILFSENVDVAEKITESLIINVSCVDYELPDALKTSSLRIHAEFIS